MFLEINNTVRVAVKVSVQFWMPGYKIIYGKPYIFGMNHSMKLTWDLKTSKEKYIENCQVC